MTRHVFIAIGSNLGDRHAYYQRALEAIAALPNTHILHESSQYETEPLGEAPTWYLRDNPADLDLRLKAERIKNTLRLVSRHGNTT